MPNWGNVAKSWSKYRFQLAVTASYSGSGTHASPSMTYDASLNSYYTPNDANTNTGVSISLVGNQTTNSEGYTVSIPDLLISLSGSGAWVGAQIIAIEFDGLKIYNEDVNLWNVSYTSLTITINGTVHSYGANSFVSNGLGPSYIWGLGVPPTIQAECAAVGKADGTTADYSYSSSATLTAVGGFQIWDGTAWHASPIELPPINMGVVSGGLTPPSASGVVTGSTTWDLTINAASTGSESTFNMRDQVNTSSSTNQNATVGAWPNEQKAIKRMQPGYNSVWDRGQFPGTKSTGAASWSSFSGATQTGGQSQVATTVIQAAQGQLLDGVRDATHPIENVFSIPCYCPLTVHTSASNYISQEPAGPPLLQNAAQVFTFPSSVDDMTHAQFNYQAHANPLVTMWNYWGNPHWQFGYFIPGSPGVPVQNVWPVDGAAVDRTYWMQIRDQMNTHPSLPPAEQTNTRTSNIASSLYNSGIQPFLDADFGGLRWIGASRWYTYQTNPPASVALDSTTSAAWSASNGTLAFGSNITVTPSGAGAVTVDLALGRFTELPRQYAQIADRIKPDWVATNVSSMDVQLVGIDGTTVSLDSPVVAGSIYTRPIASDSEYSGDWAKDDGDGYAVDTGADVPTGGISAASLADPSRNFAPQLLLGRSAAKLRFVITPADHTQPVTLKYPTFYKPTAKPAYIWESGQVCSVLYPNGPGVRFGQWEWYDPILGYQAPTPLLVNLGYEATIIDALEFAYVVDQAADPSAGGGPSALPSLTTLLATIFDTNEGQSIAVVDKNSKGIPLPGTTVPSYALINSQAEVPPLGMFPRRARDAEWLETGDYACYAYDWAVEARQIVSAVNPADLFSPGGSKWTSPSWISVPGWAITQHTHAVTNAESANYNVSQASKVYGHVTPWHGYFFIGNVLLGKALAYDVSPARTHARAWERHSDNHLMIGLAPNEPTPLVWSDVDTGISTVTLVKLQWLKFGQASLLGVFYSDSSGLHYMQTADGGTTFTTPMTITSGNTYWGLDFADAPRGVKWFYWLESNGTIYRGRYDANLNVVEGRTATNITGCDNAAIAVDDSIRAGGEFRIGIFFSAGGMPSFLTAGSDGLNFS